MKYFLNFLLLLLAVGCSSSAKRDIDSEATKAPIEFYSPEYTSVQSLRAHIKLKKKVEKWIAYFTTDLKERFEDYLSNGEQYRDMVEEILKEHQIPPELYYLPVIESGYVLHARSHMGAGGAWQFMPSTGRNYGLAYDRYLDERKNIYKATQAAAAHLRDLYNIFGSWPLALASYNAGVNRITGIIIKGSNREYWKLSEMNLLPKETSEYIPKFLAAVTIGKNPEKYGLKIDRDRPKYLSDFARVSVPNRISLRKLAKTVGIPFKELKKLNLEYRRNYV
ncbi:MAG: lytic transglycosylase domain-containing protein, partial [Bacteriovoracaceae bacterium]